jgi:hypothetical protein
MKSIFPGRSKGEDPYEGVNWGGRLDEDTSRAGTVDDGLVAWPERIIEAERQWTQAKASDFEAPASARTSIARPGSSTRTCMARRFSASAKRRTR